jgi:RNA polymerase sigma factor (sigma-70 family)
MWKMIFPAVWQILKNKEEAEDVLQESMIQGFDKLDHLRDDNSYPAWQKQIALRHALNKLKSRKTDSTLFEHIEVAEESDPQMDWNSISEELIRKKVDTLPDGYRIVIRLHLLEGWPHEDIATELGISTSTSRSQYSRAMARLKKELLEEYERSI